MNFKDLLRESTEDDDLDAMFPKPSALEKDEYDVSLSPEDNPDVWSREAIEEVAAVIDSKFHGIPESLRRSLIAWVKATDDFGWLATLDKIAAAIQRNPSVMNKLQGCRSLTQAKHFALAALRTKHAGFQAF